MSLRLSLSSICVLFLFFISTTTFATDTFRQNWSGLNDEEYIESLVDCKLTIKELQWSYNIWPKENKTEKPQFTDVVNKDDIYHSVINSL